MHKNVVGFFFFFTLLTFLPVFKMLCAPRKKIHMYVNVQYAFLHCVPTIRKTVLGKLPAPPGEAQHRQPSETHSRSSCEEGLFTFPGALDWGERIRFTTDLGATQVVSGLRRPWLHSPLASVDFMGTSQNRAYTLAWSPYFCTVTKEIYPDYLVWRPAEVAM